MLRMNDRGFRRISRIIGACVVGLALVALLAAWAQAPNETEVAMKSAYNKYKDLQEGKNADYIPALAKVNPNLFGIALITPDGQVFTAGDITSEVSIQSVSKVFT